MRLLLIMVVTASFLACKNPKKNILGKWKAISYIENSDTTYLDHFIQFTKKGNIIITGDGLSEREHGIITYQFIDDSIFFSKTTSSYKGKKLNTEQESMKYKLHKNSLELNNSKNGISILERIK